jgi:hypothetical protein
MTNCLKWKKKTKVIALDCSFRDQLKLCSKVLLLWRYEVKDFQKCPIFYLFVFFSMKTTPNTMILTHSES